MILAGLLLLLVFAYGTSRIIMGVAEQEQVKDAVAAGSRDRMVQYSAWIRGNGKDKDVFGNKCFAKTHSPMVLFSQEDSNRVDAVICMYCTDTLPTPVPLACDECWVIAVDGYLHVDLCVEHKKEEAMT